jgi:phosphoribosylanthranilate isomerase
MKTKPYVGITGPVNVQETKDICREFDEVGYSMVSPHIPMLGFLVSYKTLNGQTTQNRRYPPANSLPELLRATDGQVLTMVHYNSKEIGTLSNQVAQIFDGVYENGLCQAIQLNIVWPDIGQVARIKEQHPEMQIVFQASHKAMDGKTPNQITKGVQDYGDSISYVLIDPSGGRGMPFDLESSVAIYSELREHCPDLTIGFAGGFTGENVAPRLKEILRQIEEDKFCIDAEGGLRDKVTSAYGDDLLNIEKVKGYLQSASSVLR